MVGPEISRRLPYVEKLKISLSQSIMCVMFVGVAFGHNYIKGRPVHSSILKHVAGVAVGLYVGKWVDKFIDDKRNEKVLVIEDYISRHPEDFPLVTPKKYKDVLMPWSPLR